MTREEQIKNAYNQMGDGSGFYDGMITYSTIPGKVTDRVVF